MGFTEAQQRKTQKWKNAKAQRSRDAEMRGQTCYSSDANRFCNGWKFELYRKHRRIAVSPRRRVSFEACHCGVAKIN